MIAQKRTLEFSISALFNALIILTSLLTGNVSAKDPAKVIAGWVEKVRIEDHQFDVKAKLDTGARTSSIHARDIESYKKDRRHKIKNHDGEHDRRHVVDLEVCFNGRRITTEFTLADRREYIYDILLGRQFLVKAAIVDPNSVFLTAAICE